MKKQRFPCNIRRFLHLHFSSFKSFQNMFFTVYRRFHEDAFLTSKNAFAPYVITNEFCTSTSLIQTIPMHTLKTLTRVGSAGTWHYQKGRLALISKLVRLTLDTMDLLKPVPIHSKNELSSQLPTPPKTTATNTNVAFPAQNCSPWRPQTSHKIRTHGQSLPTRRHNCDKKASKSYVPTPQEPVLTLYSNLHCLLRLHYSSFQSLEENKFSLFSAIECVFAASFLKTMPSNASNVFALSRPTKLVLTARHHITEGRTLHIHQVK